MDWTLDEHRAHGAWGNTTALIDTLDLRTGLLIQSGSWQGSSLGALPAITPANNAASIETYVRGTDLVTTHPATSTRPTRVQLYWRRWHELPASVAAVVELIASVQTHLLDSDPTLVIESHIAKCVKSEQTDGATHLQGDTSQMLILVHRNDETEVQLQPADTNVAIKHTLFRSRLEKGVILRGRLLFVLGDQSVTDEALQECADRFYSSEPMLTA